MENELGKQCDLRLVVVDSLRGLALFGILLANVPIARYPINENLIGSHNTVDYVLDAFFHLLIDKKLITIFGILFGFGFFI